jgi:hypothetical protein
MADERADLRHLPPDTHRPAGYPFVFFSAITALQFVVLLLTDPERFERMTRRSRFYSIEIQRWPESPKIL